MKKIKLIVSALLFSISINAQISLENTYSGNSNVTSIGFVNLANSGDKYVINDVSLSQIKLYNLNHTLWKTIPIPSLPNSTSYYYQNISENLFDLDSEVECLIVYAGATIQEYQIAVINENGNVIFNKTSCGFSGIHKTENNSYKLLLSDYTNTNKYVYSLPGTSSNLGVIDNGVIGKVGLSFPNPTSQLITLPYDLGTSNSIGTMNIYNINGQIVESFTVDNTFTNILLDVSSYAIGTYRYSIIIDGIESTSNSFIKQ